MTNCDTSGIVQLFERSDYSLLSQAPLAQSVERQAVQGFRVQTQATSTFFSKFDRSQ